MDLVTLVYSCI